MRTLTTFAFLALLLVLPGQLQAQQSTADAQAELRTLVSEDVSDASAERAAIADFLEREDVAEAARSGGIDLERVQAAVPALAEEDAQRVAERVEQVEDQLAGGDTFVISTTTIIIARLVVILIIVA